MCIRDRYQRRVRGTAVTPFMDNVTTSCACGAVKIRFAASMPQFAAECACVDCFGKLFHMETKGGPSLAAEIRSRDKCIQTWYFPDKFTVESGKEKLEFSKVRPEAMSTSCVATCCHTIVAVDNPFYHQGQGNIGSTDGSGLVMVFNDVTPTGCQDVDIGVRWWINDLPEGNLAAMPALPGVYNAVPGDFETLSFVEGGEAAFASFNQAAAQPALEEVEGQSFGELLAEWGGEVKVDPYE
eukprot:TRINITY_DN16597_c0_g1_i1.p1 TRINITY_DN16597_c0_g1~~TRINITY_DN16597_c0_g1_i1.p1  ORF type:complete len:240 (+),score=68.75 TRINITY_DN16597_c0_g1_i1:185-904(+)